MSIALFCVCSKSSFSILPSGVPSHSVEMCDGRQRCYHHGCEETTCWFQKAQAVGGGEEGDYLVLHRSRTDGDSKSSKAAKHQHEQLRGVRRSQGSSPASPLISLPVLGKPLQSTSPTMLACFSSLQLYTRIVQCNCNAIVQYNCSA